MKRQRYVGRGDVRCHGCDLYFPEPPASATRAEEVLCVRCRAGKPVELSDAFGLPREFKPYTPRSRRSA